MGSGSSKDHDAFTVAPPADDDASPSPTPTVEPVTASDQQIIDQYPDDGVISDIAGASSFAEMSEAVQSAQSGLALTAGLPAEQQIPQLAEESNKAIHAATIDWLDGKSKQELDDLASAQGFPHPEIVSKHALTAWLDPSYPSDAEYKAKIAAKSVERYNAAVAAGKIVPAPTIPELPEGHWKATPAEVLDAQSAFMAAAQAHGDHGGTADSLQGLIDAENKLATAHCPELGESLAASQAQAKELVDAKIEKGYAANHLVNHAIQNGALPEDADLLSRSEALKLLRESTPGQEKADLHQLITDRTAKLAEKNAAQAKLSELCGGAHWAGKPQPFKSAADVIAYNNAAQTVATIQQEAQTWKCVNSPYGSGGSKVGGHVPNDNLAQGLRHGAKSLSMDQLRAAATMEGLKDTKGASRAELQNWLIGKWHPGIKQDEIATGIAAKKAKKKTPPPAPTPTPTPAPTPANSPSKTGSPAGTATSSTPTGLGTVTPLSPTAGSGKWFHKQQQMVAALKHQTASLADAPPRPPTAEVAAWQFSSGPAMHLGGAHTKEVVTAPDGSLWMFKPTKDKYRALSESGANGILHRAGIPTVPVYARPYDGKLGTVQPLIKGATTFPSDPGKWSQSDVDAVVRYHAAAWLVGDHDAKHDNLLRTPSGGLVPCDHGQAFKFWGQDKLEPGYHPNASYGSHPPVWNVLYDAAKNGQLAPGVKVRPAAALPVIKSIESIPDTEFAAMLEPAAKAGAGSSTSHWRPVFEKRAAAKLGKTPTAQQVAEEFITYGVERKQALRQSFMKFFADAKVDNADVIMKVA
ncbi:hypothetical protein [Mycobacterium hubeiense]|uniref:hypothetical protein n=1 Tax=Mycobacterium hubeiense TaxID=1867256 RepID=UPI000C7EC1FF|nr:hypothetical protein [Mycobacterium sp. QGD 101]